MTVVAKAADGYVFDHWSYQYHNGSNLVDRTNTNATWGSKQMGLTTGNTSYVYQGTTIYAHFRLDAPPTYTVTWKSEDGLTTLETDADLASGTATSFDAATPTKAATAQYTYTFDGWATEANGAKVYNINGTPAATADVTYYAHFSSSVNSYTITFLNGDGSTLQSGLVAYGATPSCASTPTQAATAQYTYTFNTWSPAITSVTGAQTYTPLFNSATNTYSVSASVSPAGAGTVSGTGTFEYGTNVALSATPTNRRYQFVRWTESASEVGTAASYTISSLAAAHTLVAEFEEIPVTIADNESSSYYASTLSTFSATMDFRLMRTFKAGMWNTVCFPFDLTSAQRGNSDMSGVIFYTLTSVTGDAAVGLDFNVTAVTTETMTARTPYLVQFTGADIVNPVFNDVTLAANAFTNNTSGTNVGDTKFFGTVHPTALEIGQSSGFLFLGQNNNLYWPNVNNDIRAFRAYFYSGSSTVQSVHPRARIVVRGETPTDVEERIADGNASAPRKYLHNGVLVIEKNGIRYNAVGQPLSE